MAMVCANGHDSDWDDWCSVCGDAIGAVGPATAAPEASSAEVSTASKSELGEAASSCPNCAETHAAGDVFCENCGYDFLSGTLPESSGESPLVGEGSTSGGVASEGVAPTIAVVSVDLEFFERMGFAGVEPPATLPESALIDLPPTDILIGRHSESRGTFPDIDLAKIFEGDAVDPAVSTSHCRLTRSKLGWTITDLDSTNGTYLADETDPLKPGTPISLTPGTAIFVGAWTKIELVDA